MDAPLPVTLAHEQIANEAKHWVRLTAACNSKCVFCLDAEAQDGRFMELDDIEREIRRGREDKAATRLVVSGGEASIHPRFCDAVRYGKQVGYRWVQTVTNGRRFADRAFYEDAVRAGLDELTFSLHGHTPELHDRLTRAKNGFADLVKAMARAARDPRVVVNVDVCINKQNVEHLEAIVALCARLGVREFDLLHVIPQGVAFDHREELFYDPAEHAESLRRVFKLARLPGFHVWTNRFPLAQLEGLEELIQDPHKMLDEVGGRRMQFRRYLDRGEPIECRDPQRCPHCFIEPFCTSLDRFVEDGRESRFDAWWIGARHDLASLVPSTVPYLGVREIPPGVARPLYVAAETFRGAELPAGSRAIATTAAHLDELAAFAGPVEVRLDRALADALRGRAIPANWILYAPTHLHAAESFDRDPDWTEFFASLPPGARAANLPPCLAPGAVVEEAPRILDLGLFHATGELAIDPFVDHYVRSEYRAKSLRCRACVHDASCDGAHVQWIRAHGFSRLEPVRSGAAMARRGRAGRLSEGAVSQAAMARVPVPGNAPVPEIDVLPGRRS